MTRSPRATVAVATMLLAACVDEPVRPSSTVSPTPLELRVEPAQPRAGDTVLVRVRWVSQARGATRVASFGGQLLFDPTALIRITPAQQSPGIRAVNAEAGRLRVAAVALGGFPDGELLAERFVVRQTKGVGTLRFVLLEATGTDFSRQLPADPTQRQAQPRARP